jgi:hypothetical protein
VRPSPTAGQASLEYIAVISLVAALLLLAAPAVGAPSIADTVARGIRIGLCVVDDGICTREDAMAAGLPPCQLDLATRGYDARVTAFSIELGSRDTLTGFRSSDGSFSLMWSASGSLGVAIGADLPFVPVSRDGAARAKLTAARGWTFPDEATLRRFIAGMPKSAANQARWPAAWHTVDGSVQAEAELKTKAGNLDLEKLDGTVTVYASMNFEGPEKTWAAMPSTGPGKESAVIEVTLNGASPRSVALRVTAPSEQNSRLTETVYRVPLNGLLPPPPRKIPDQARFFGTIERNVYSYSDSTRGISGEVAAGIKLGADAKIVDIRRTLIDATAQTPGSDKERSRFDCLDQLR